MEKLTEQFQQEELEGDKHEVTDLEMIYASI